MTTLKSLQLLLWVVLLPLLGMTQHANVELNFSLAFADSCTITTDNFHITAYNTVHASAINENHCRFNIPVSKALFATLTYNGQQAPLFLIPGADLTMQVSTDSLYKAIVFTGKAAAENTFLNAFLNRFSDSFNSKIHESKMNGYTIDNYEMELFDDRKKQEQYLKEQMEFESLNADFKYYLQEKIKYNYYGNLLTYPISRANQSAQILTVKALPEVMLEAIDKTMFINKALSVDAYREFVKYYVIYFTSKANGYNKFRDFSMSMEAKIKTAQQHLPDSTLAWFIADFLNSDCEKVAPVTVKHVYGILKELEAKPYYSALLKVQCEKCINTRPAVTAKVKPAAAGVKSELPQLKDINGKTFNFDQLKGKSVYIDFWASWCGPCRQQFPASKKLHDRFTAKQLKKIAFVYISIDATEDAWKKAVEQNGLDGINVISPGNWESEVVKYFKVNSIPRYMLMDQNGNIVDDNAPRPSTGDEIYNRILELID